MNESMNHYAGDVPWTPQSPFASIDNLRAFVDERVRKVLEEDARAIQEHKAFQPIERGRTTAPTERSKG